MLKIITSGYLKYVRKNENQTNKDDKDVSGNAILKNKGRTYRGVGMRRVAGRECKGLLVGNANGCRLEVKDQLEVKDWRRGRFIGRDRRRKGWRDRWRRNGDIGDEMEISDGIEISAA